MKNKHVVVLLGLGLLITVAPLFAHHGTAAFDFYRMGETAVGSRVA